MDARALRAQIRASTQTIVEAAAGGATDLRVQFFAALLSDLGAHEPALELESQRFRAWRADTADAVASARLQSEGCTQFLRTIWEGLGESHYAGKELLVLADWLVASTSTADEIAQLPYAIGNWNGTWHDVGKIAAAACEKIAAAALARDPENEAALYLYAQPDFLASVNRSRPKGAKLTGPPIPARPASADLEKIARVVRLFEEDVVHPLDIPSLDPVAVATPEIARAMIRHLETTSSWRARLRLIEALGRAEAAIDEVTASLARQLESRDPATIDAVAMAAHYGLRARGVGLLGPLVATTERLVGAMREDAEEYHHLWPLRAVRTLARHAKGPARANAKAFIARLLGAGGPLPSGGAVPRGARRGAAPCVGEGGTARVGGHQVGLPRHCHAARNATGLSSRAPGRGDTRPAPRPRAA